MAVPLPLRYAEREARVWRRLWYGSVSTGILTPILFLGAMGLGVGGLVDEHTGTVEGVDYLTFVAPGLLLAAAAQHVTPTMLWGVMAGQKWMGQFHGAVATPMRPTDVYLGLLAWQGAHTAMNAVPFLAVAALMGGVPSAWGVLALPVSVVTTLAIAAPVAAYSSTQDSDTSFAAIMRILILPLVLFSGTFFPVDNLPAALEPVAWVSPLWHGVELARSATTGSLSPAADTLHLLYLCAWLAVCLTWGSRAFHRRLHS